MTQTGSESCLLGNTWGYDDKGIWVAEGCGGRFVLGQPEATQEEEVAGFLRNFEPYVSLLGHLAVFDDEAEIQDNTSWIGLKFSTGDEIKFFAHVELGLNLIGGVDPFRAGSGTDSGLLTGESLDDPPVLGSRLGYIGVDFGAGGRIALGKDKGQHYAIAGYTTDRWNAFGGEGSLAYPGSGDGGASGTGRADQVVNYRVTLADRVDLGAQLQFSNASNHEAVDGYGASLQLTILDGLKLGAAYTQTEIEDFLEGAIIGVDGDAEYSIVGLNYTSDVLDVGAVFSTQENGDVRLVSVLEDEAQLLVPVVFDGDGMEIYVRGKFGGFGITGGYIDYSPDIDVPLLAPDFEINYFILGADWRFAENVGVYTELRIDDSVLFDGVEGSDVAVLGIHYTASWKTSHNP
jgi:predicted porin